LRKADDHEGGTYGFLPSHEVVHRQGVADVVGDGVLAVLARHPRSDDVDGRARVEPVQPLDAHAQPLVPGIEPRQLRQVYGRRFGVAMEAHEHRPRPIACGAVEQHAAVRGRGDELFVNGHVDGGSASGAGRTSG
jgi:hypothetical protein